MIRNFKALGLAFAAVFALSAVAASAASAEQAAFKAPALGAGETAGIDGGQTKERGDSFTVNGLKLTCAIATLTGKALTAGPSSTEVTLNPKYENCHVKVSFLTFPATVTMNSCDYTFNATKNTAGTEFSADLEIGCDEPEDQIEIHIYGSKAKHEADEPMCTYDIEPQTVLNKIQLTNGASDVTAKISELPVVLNNTIKSATCGEAEHPTSLYNGEDTLQATNEKGKIVSSEVG